MIEKENINKECLKRVADYQNLNIHGRLVNTPYMINRIERDWVEMMRRAGIPSDRIREVTEEFHNKQVDYGWYRGKGTPEEIVDATIKISRSMGFPLEGASDNLISSFMQQCGLGVDCSGFVYNVLDYAFATAGLDTRFHESLDWEDRRKQGVNRAGVFTFAGEASSLVVPEEMGALDLILLRSSRQDEGYIHMALVLRERMSFVIAQSVLSVYPTGVNVSKLRLSESGLSFDFRPESGKSWDVLYGDGLLEVRRLKLLKDE